MNLETSRDLFSFISFYFTTDFFFRCSYIGYYQQQTYNMNSNDNDEYDKGNADDCIYITTKQNNNCNDDNNDDNKESKNPNSRKISSRNNKLLSSPCSLKYLVWILLQGWPVLFTYPNSLWHEGIKIDSNLMT